MGPGYPDSYSVSAHDALEQAAKCLVLVVKLDRRTRRHVLAVVPGDSKVDLAAAADLFAARYAGSQIP